MTADGWFQTPDGEILLADVLAWLRLGWWRCEFQTPDGEILLADAIKP